jgi:hypothetical protein
MADTTLMAGSHNLYFNIVKSAWWLMEERDAGR